ncbi:hypothetical protein GY45DRAFT_828154 [Cubamyces sp. BRFM 1775]|nr:hypothetical protein GY45DRAFT_828154 [Cubamyces sp. BRFM 1775]
MTSFGNLKPVASSNLRALRQPSESRHAQQQQNYNASRKARTRGVRKVLEVLNLPFDVFYEVASHLNPIDLLQLSRASKDLRSFLLSRKSRPLWSTVFKNIVPQMPACPEHISEPRYAHVVFERTCDACGVDRSVKVDYATPVRFCGACWKTNVKKGRVLAQEAGIKKTERDEIFCLLPKAGSSGYKPVATLDQRATDVFYEPDFKAVVQRHRQLLRSKEQDTLQGFLDERRELSMRRLNFQHAVIEWEWETRKQREQEDRDHMNERRSAIEEKLRELGYEPSDYPSYGRDFNSMLHQPRKLTPRIWNTIRPKLIKILDDERQKRADTAFRNKWWKRIKQFKNHYTAFLQQDRDKELEKRTLPGFEDAFAQALDLIPAAEPDADVTQEELTAFETAVLKHADEYRARVRGSLVELVQQASSLSPAQPPQKAQRTTRGKKGKGKRKASRSDDSEDSAGEETSSLEAECALLDAHTSLFACRIISYGPACRGPMSYLDLMEHWQHCHGSMRWSTDRVQCVNGDLTHVAALVTAMELPADSTLMKIREVIHNGRPECACGRYRGDLDLGTVPPYQHFARVLAHVENRSCGYAPATPHHITFKPGP